MGWLFALVACAPAPEEKVPEVQEPPVDIDWGSWEIHPTFVQQDDICTDFGANGAGLGTLYGEMNVEETAQIAMALGDKALEGTRDSEGFEMTAFNPIPVNGADPEEYGIGAVLSGTVLDMHHFTGVLLYQLDFPDGLCIIELDVDAYWMYYEPPPACGG